MFESVFSLARFLSRIEFEFLTITVNSNGFFHFNYDEKSGRRKKEELLSELKVNFKQVNRMICQFNKIKNDEFAFLRSEDIILADFDEFAQIVREREFTDAGKKHALYRRDVFFEKLHKSISDFVHSFDKMLDVFGGPNRKWRMRRKNFRKLAEIMSIYSFGFFESAVIVCSKHLDELITEYLKLLKRVKRINHKMKEINAWDFDTKINILRKERKITENQKVKLLSIKWDRNSCAHPVRKSELSLIKSDADAIILLSVNSLQYFETRICALYKKLGIKV
jgi:hypothetical protein